MRSWMIVSFGFALTVMAVPALGQGTSADEAAIIKVLERFAPAWAKGDAKTLAALYTTDADYVSSTGFTARGRTEIEKTYVGQFSGVYKGTSLKQATTSIRFIKPDVAIVNSTFEVAGLRGRDGEEVPPRKGMNTNVLVKQNGQWLITAHRGWVPPAAPVR